VPANLKHYKGIVDVIKLEGRALPTPAIIGLLRHYCMDTGSARYPENCLLTELPFYHPYRQGWEPEGVFERVKECGGDCVECGYCHETWKKAYGFTEATEEYVKGYSAYARKNYREAYESFSSYITGGGTADGKIHYLMGICLKKVGEYGAALVELNKAAKANPHEWSVYNLLGSVYRETGEYESAEKMMKEAIRLSPYEWSNYNLLGNMYMTLGRPAEAVKMLEKALYLGPEPGYSEKIKENISSITKKCLPA
jgi:tetratricopeptide (TPR) repeat protein